MEEKEILELITQRQAMKEKIEEIETSCRTIDKQIESAVGEGTHHIGQWSVQSITADVTTFDTKRFKAEHPDVAEQYNVTAPRHTFKIIGVK